MLISLIFVVLILAIAYFQASQGWYSAMIMAVLTICCAGAAFGTHEWVAVNLFAKWWKPDYAHPLALAAVFGVSLVVLRLLFDQSLRRTCLLPLMIDRVGGGVCGFVTAMTMVGVFAASVQMIPFQNGAVLGFARVPVSEAASAGDSSSGERDLWLMPDRFAVGLATFLSSGVFGGGESLYVTHPDLVQEIGWTNAAPAEVSRFAAPGSVSVDQVESVAQVFRLIPSPDEQNTPPTYEPLEPKPGHEFRLVRVRLGPGARDERKSHVFTLRQFRLVGSPADTSALTQFHAIAIQQEDAADTTNRHIRFRKVGAGDKPVADIAYSPRSGDTVEIVFETPKGFQPTILAYKRGAQAPMPAPKRADASSSAPAETPPTTTTESGTSNAPAEPAPPTGRTREGRGDGRAGNIRGLATKIGGSFFGDALPVELTKYRASNSNIERGTLVSGHLVAEEAAQSGGTDPPVSRFAVPEDKRLLQLNVAKLQARSGLGRAITFAVATVQNYFVQDANGNRYEVVGKYAVADVNGTSVIEVQYYSERAGTIGQLGKFDRIRENELKQEDAFVLLFLVNPGAHIIGFSTGGDATRADDLTAENLVAPQ